MWKSKNFSASAHKSVIYGGQSMGNRGSFHGSHPGKCPGVPWPQPQAGGKEEEPHLLPSGAGAVGIWQQFLPISLRERVWWWGDSNSGALSWPFFRGTESVRPHVTLQHDKIILVLLRLHLINNCTAKTGNDTDFSHLFILSYIQILIFIKPFYITFLPK